MKFYEVLRLLSMYQDKKFAIAGDCYNRVLRIEPTYPEQETSIGWDFRGEFYDTLFGDPESVPFDLCLTGDDLIKAEWYEVKDGVCNKCGQQIKKEVAE